MCFNATLGPQRRATLYSCDSHGVIQHECVHGFCHLTFGSTGPTWLAEGVAELGNYWRDGDTSVEIDPGVMAYIRTTTPKRRLAEIAVPGREPAGTWQDDLRCDDDWTQLADNEGEIAVTVQRQ